MKGRAPSLNRYFAAILCVALLATAAAATISWLHFAEQRSALLRESRFQFSLNSVIGNLESGLRLGLPLADLPGAQGQIEHVRVRDPGILSIDVFDGDGRILFTTDHGGVGAHLPAARSTPCLANGGWRGRDEDGSMQCGVLQNSYEQVIGGVLLRYQPVTRAGTINLLNRHWSVPRMMTVILVLLASLAALAIGAAWLRLRPLEQRLEALAAGVETDRLAPAPGTLAGPLPAALVALERRAETLRAAGRETDRIDDLDLA